MNDAMHTAIAVFFWVLASFAIVVTIFAIWVMWTFRKAIRRARKLERLVNAAWRDNSSVVNFDQNIILTRDEQVQVRDWLRFRKTKQAANDDTIRRATEFQGDFEPHRPE